jgi:hypothetical protein
VDLPDFETLKKEGMHQVKRTSLQEPQISMAPEDEFIL